MCQLEFIDELGRENSQLNSKWQYVRRCSFYITERQYLMERARTVLLLYARELFRSAGGGSAPQDSQQRISPGDTVRVLSKSEIQKRLDRSGRTGRCRFTPGMYKHCGKQYKVFKKVDHFYDEVKQKMCRTKNLVLLEGAHCSPSNCDRNCFYFWHVNWLEKI